MEKYAQALLTVLSLVNPLICGTLFVKIAGNKSRVEQIGDATRAVLAIMVILCSAAIAGARLLKLFGISMDAFQVAGGMLLIWMGFLMLRGTSSPTSNSGENAGTQSLAPLILFAASPGTIMGVITLSVAHSQSEIPLTALVAVLAALAITWLRMIIATRSAGVKKQGLMHDVTSRFMGLIVLAMGVQFSLTGLETFF